MDRAREVFQTGWMLGWLLKAWTLSDLVQACNPHVASFLDAWMCKIILCVYNAIRQELELEEDSTDTVGE